MRLKFLLLLGAGILIVACTHQKKNNVPIDEKELTQNQFDFPDSLSARRISFVLNLKQAVAKNTWSDFGKKTTEGTMIYFNADKSEVFFPDSLVIERLNSYDAHSEDYVLTARTDTIPFHMENMLSFDQADSSKFYFNNPVEQYCSVEEIAQYIPSVESTEMWSTMVLHEMFHHYQLNNLNFKEYAQSEISTLEFNPNDMFTLCQEDKNYLTMIQQENDLLMKAISEKEESNRGALISSYLQKRKSRITSYGKEYSDLEKVEDFYVIQEGSARYVEYKGMTVLSDFAKNPDSIFIEKDPMFKSYTEFKEIDLTDQAFNYLTYAGPTDYHYTVGFNTMRLLDVLKIDYKSKLLNEPQKSLHKYLEEYLHPLHN